MRVRPTLVVIALASLAASARAQVHVEQYAIDPPASPPARRSCGAALEALADRDRIWIFSGFAGGFLFDDAFNTNPPSGDLWRFDTSTSTWTQVVQTGAVPSARDQHAFAFDESSGRVILFGGFRINGTNFAHNNDLFAFDPTTGAWTALTQSNPRPSARSSATFVYLPHRGDFLLVGGHDIAPQFPFGATGGALSDVWRLSISGDSATWTSVTPTGAANALPRGGACAAYDEANHRVVMFGGVVARDGTAFVSDADTWLFDVDAAAFTPVTSLGAAPLPRAFCGAAVDASSGRLLVYGGQLDLGESCGNAQLEAAFGETCDDGNRADGDGCSRHCTSEPDNAPAIVVFGDAFSFDAATSTWTQQTTDLDVGPLQGQAAVFSPHLDRMWSFGGRVSAGQTSIYDDETYTFDLQVGGPPTASAGADQSVDEESTVQLDASASSDPDGFATLSFSWAQRDGPPVSLSDAGAVAPTFVAPTVSADVDLTFEVVVSDGSAAASDIVVIHVRDALNDPPLADAGGAQIAIEGALVTLDGSGSSDPDQQALSFAWTQVSGPTIVLDDASSPTPQFIAPAAPAALTFLLTVDDGAASASDTVDISVTTAANAPPAARAGADFDVAPGIEVTLDGSGSSDPNGDPLSFAWAQTAGPAIFLDDASAAQPRFASPVSLGDADVALTLTVSDGVFVSSDDVVVHVRASLGAPRFASLPREIAVVAQPYAYDDDDSAAATGSGTSYYVISAPPGFSVDAQSGLVSWVPDVAGTFSVELGASNAAGDDVQRFSVEAFAPPVITSTPNTTMTLGAPYHYDDDDTLSASGSGPIAWTLVDGPPLMVLDVESGRMTWIPVLPDDTTVRVRAENAFGSDEQVFLLSRPPEARPRIGRTANPYGAVGHRYLFDLDSTVDIENRLPGDVVVVAPRAPTPPGLFVPASNPVVLWNPESPGVFHVALDLISAVGAPLDAFEFDVNVVDLGDDDQALAVAAASPTAGPAPLSVSFDMSASRGAGGAPIFLHGVDTGDGAIVGNLAPLGAAASPLTSHTYVTPGSYTARVEVHDAYGIRDTDKITISVLEGDKQPPTARIAADVLDGQDQLTVNFSCDCRDADGPVGGVLWSYGDGTTASGNNVTHTYVQPGNYHVRVTAVDADGLTGSDAVEVRVRSGDLAPPRARIAATPAEGDQPMSVQLVADVGDDDGVVVDVQWSLPDGTVRSGPTVEHTFVSPGYYPVLLAARDDDGLVGRDVITIAVRADGVRPPRIVSLPSTRAVAGEPWRYDDDDRAVAQGGRPIVWRLGKTIDGALVNAPEGMTVDLATGALSWTPRADQVGEHRVSLVAENGVGADLQEFVVVVQPGAITAGAGCGCTSGPDGAPLALLAFLLLPGFARRARGLLVVALLCTTAARAAPTLTTAAPIEAAVGQLFVYDADAVGEGAVGYALADAPDGMVLDNTSGVVTWMPTNAGVFDVVLVAGDRTGLVEQRFTLDVRGGVPATLTFQEPPGGYVFRTDEVGTFLPGTFLVPAEGDLPLQFFTTDNDDPCLIVQPTGAGYFHYASPTVCTITINVANPWGQDRRTLTVAFVDPPDEERLVDAVLSATPFEGPAPLLVTFDGTASRFPVDDPDWLVATTLVPGDSDVGILSEVPERAEYIYTQPGTYHAEMQIVIRSVSSIITISDKASVTIVVEDAGARPPSTSIVPSAAQGPAPHTVSFTSATIAGDAPILNYVLDFGDGDRFETTTTTFGGGAFADPVPSHTYAQPGTYTATLTVTDTLGRSSIATTEIVASTSAGTPPFARILAFPARGEVPLTVNLDAERGDLDGYVVRSTWILPGGDVSAAETVSIVLEEPGEHVVELLLADDDGLETRARAVVAATRDGTIPPRVVSVANLQATAGQPYRYDDDGTVTVVGGGPYRFSLGKEVGGEVLNAPAGMTIDERTGALAWTPADDVVGEVPVSIVVENVAGRALHEFIVVASAASPQVERAPPASCASLGASSAGGLVALLCLRRRRRPHR